MNNENKKNIIRGSTLKRLFSLFLTILMILQITPISSFAFSSTIWDEDTFPDKKHPGDPYTFTYTIGESDWAVAGDKSTPVDYLFCYAMEIQQHSSHPPTSRLQHNIK